MKIQKKRLDIVLCVIAMIVAALTIFCETNSSDDDDYCAGVVEISRPSSASGQVFHIGDTITFTVSLTNPDQNSSFQDSDIEWGTDSGEILGTGISINVDWLAAGDHTITATETATGADCNDSVSIQIIDTNPGTYDFNIISPSDGAVFDLGQTIRFETSVPLGGSPVHWETYTGGIHTSIGTGNPLETDSMEKGSHTITASTSIGADPVSDSITIDVVDPVSPPAISIPDTGLDEYYDDDWPAIPITNPNIPDIGDDFYGQDAHYVKDISHTVDDTLAIPIVTDDVTQLVWQKGDSAVAYNWTKANEYCSGLVGGWRLPNQEELMTIVNYGMSNPTGFVEFDMRSQYYWSSTEFASDTTQAWGVNFYYGHSQDMSKETPFADMYTRCVKDTGVSFPDGHMFEVLPGKPDVITDVTTGYQWHQADNGTSTLNWLEALDHCEVSQAGGFDDWKLPDVKELNTIVDRSKASAPFIDPLFSTTAVGLYESQSFWTSTTDPFMPGSFGSAWQVNFKTGRIASSYKQYGEPAFVRCMRIP